MNDPREDQVGPRAAERVINTVVKQHAETIAAACVARIEAFLWQRARAGDLATVSERVRGLSAEDWLRAEVAAKLQSALDLSEHAAVLGLRLVAEGPKAEAPPAPAPRLELAPAISEPLRVLRGPGDDFLRAWLDGETVLPVTLARTEDLYRAYRRWCAKRQQIAAGMNWCVVGWRRMSGVAVRRIRYGDGTQSVVVVPPPSAASADSREQAAYELRRFAQAVEMFCLEPAP
jgi:hypothetical protein